MKKVLLFLAIIAVVGGGYAYYLYNKPVADTEDIKAAYELSAHDLFSQFESNENEANTKYLGKMLEVSGTIRDFSIGDSGELSLMLNSGNEMFGINCGLSKGQDSRYKNYQVGDSIKIKGECSGISMDVVLTRCIIVN